MKLLRLAALLCSLNGLAHPVPENPQWLTYAGGEGPGKGKHIVLIAADQEYRSEQSMPMLAKILSTRHGFDCTVLYALNDQGLVDPTMPVYPEKGKEKDFKTHHIAGLECVKVPLHPGNCMRGFQRRQDAFAPGNVQSLQRGRFDVDRMPGHRQLPRQLVTFAIGRRMLGPGMAASPMRTPSFR